ncbi:hypothetical protein LNKW23_44550 [Paralimibaculum aggregatum]|uniref:histidine kinase n=1 Tax=Paralimibaculum aggregatum TaxID=3036245 RepID=A0ABQ6LT22_9RHOB|nr:ATP-binding protein [Limibaculum sp. NKW23]GMG85238.1 hypothetical protein LNKW23_44550 [Limibaculum sp. NKW23]
MIHAGILCAVLLVLCAGFRPGTAAASADTLTRQINVGLFDNAPKIFRDDKGDAQGFFPGLIDAIAERHGMRVVYVPCELERCVQMVRRGEIDILPDVAYTEEGVRRMRFGREPVLQTWSALYTRQGSSRPLRDLADLDGRRVAVMQDGPQERELREAAARTGFEVEIIALPSLIEVMRAVSRGDADIGVVNHHFGLAHEDKFALERSSIVFRPLSLYFVYSPGVPQSMVEVVDATVALMKADPKSEYYALLDRWLVRKSSFALPDWVPIVTGLTAALLLASLGVNAYLRKAVAEKTSALRESQNRLKAIFDNAPVEIYLKDCDGRYIEINKQFEMLFNVQAEDIVGKLPQDVHYSSLADRTRAHDLHVIETGQTLAREEYATTELGDRILHTVKFPVFDAAGEISGVGAVVADVTEQTLARERAIEVEQRLLDAINILPDGFVLFDSDDRLVMCNDKFREIFARSAEIIEEGVSYEAFLRYGVRNGQFLDAEGQEEAWVAECLERHRTADSSFEIRLPDDRWVRVVERRTASGGSVGFRFDITEAKRQARALDSARKRAEAAAGQLREQTRKLAQVVEITGIGGWELDVESDTLFWDSITKSIHEVPRWYEPTLDAAMAFYTPDSRRTITEAVTTCIERRLPFDRELELVTATGRSIWVRATGQPLVENGRLKRLMGALQDITAQKAHERSLEESWLAAEKANIAKSQFLANMSHEIRTPMNGVTGMLALLLRSDLTEPQRVQAQTAHASASGLMQILNDILDYSKLEANEVQIDSAPYDLRDVVDEVFAMLELRAKEKRLALRIEIDEEVPKRMLGDPARVRQVLVNLAGNAIKFTESGEVCVRAGLDPRNDGFIRLEVRDTGIGISSEGQKTLFTRFAQADGTIGRRYGGTGLGLAISKQLVEALGGQIGVESSLGTGSLFWFTLPIEHRGSNSVALAFGTAAR